MVRLIRTNESLHTVAMPSNTRAELLARIDEANSAVARAFTRLQDNQVFQAELPMQQLRALMLIDALDVVTARDLATSLEIGRSTATELVDRLEERGLVRRENDPGDRRVRRVVLTRDGEATMKRVSSVAHGDARELFELLTDDELAALATGLGGLLRAAEAIASRARP